jgi:hypothetical protein
MTLFNYKPNQQLSPKGLFVAKEQTKPHEGKFHIQSTKGIHPLFTYNVHNNRLVYIGGIAEISPEALQDIAELCSNIFDDDK